MHDQNWQLAKVRGENEKLKREIAELKSKIAAITQMHNEAREKLQELVKAVKHVKN